MLFYTWCHYVAKGKITVYDTDTNSMKLEKRVLFEIGPEAFICTSMTATAIFVLFVIVPFFWEVSLISYIHIQKKALHAWIHIRGCQV